MPTDLDQLRGQRIADLFPDPSGTQGTVSLSTVRSVNDGTQSIRDQTIGDLAPGEAYWSRKAGVTDKKLPLIPEPSKLVAEQARKKALTPIPSPEAIGRLVPMAMRIGAGGAAGPIGAAAVEPIAQQMEEDLGGVPKSWKRGALNVAATKFPALFGGGQSVVGQVAGHVAQGAAMQGAYDTAAYASGVDQWRGVKHELANLGTGAAMGLGFGLLQAPEVAAQLDARFHNQVAESHAANGGGTFDPHTRMSLSGRDAWAVGVAPENTIELPGDRPLTGQDIDDARRQWGNYDPRLKVGTWLRDNEDGSKTHVLDQVATVKDRNLAIELAKAHNQQGIFHLGTQEYLDTGGTGTPPDSLPPLRDRLAALDSEYPTPLARLRAAGARAADTLRPLLADETGKIGEGKLPRPARMAALRSQGLGETLRTAEAGQVPPEALEAPRTAGRAMTPTGMTVRNALAGVASGRLLEGPYSFEDFTGDMVKRYGDPVRPHLEDAWKTGVGAYDRAMQRVNLPSVERTVELLNKGRDGSEWYGDMARDMRRTFGDDAPRFTRLLAATSPQASVTSNLTLAMKAYVRWQAGARAPEDFQGISFAADPGNIAKAASGEPFGGPKVREFLRAMNGDPNATVIDRWMFRYLGLPGDHAATPTEYEAYANLIRRMAGRQNLSPAQFQETVWKGLKKESDPSGKFTDKPYNQIVRDLHAQGRPLINDRVMGTFTDAEQKIAARINETFRQTGRAYSTAESGQIRADLPFWVASQVLKGVRSLPSLAKAATATFGEKVRTFLPDAWVRGRQQALRTASVLHANGEGVPPEEEPLPRSPEQADAQRRVKEYSDAFGENGANVRAILEHYTPEVVSQTRGTQHDWRRDQLAEDLQFNLTRPGRPGQNLSPERTQALLDTIHTLDTQVQELAAKSQSVDLTTREQADFAEKQQALQALHLTAIGSRAEAGRTLRVWQTARQTRALVGDAEFIRQGRRAGLNDPQIAKLLATAGSPFERAQLLRAQSKRTWGDVYRHAVYSAMFSHPATWGQVAIGNALSEALHNASIVPGAIASKIFNRGNRYVSLHDLKPSVAGPAAGLMAGWNRTVGLLRHGMTDLDVINGASFAKEVSLDQLLGREPTGAHPVADLAMNLPTRMLGAAHTIVRGVSHEIEMNRFMYQRARAQSMSENLQGDTAFQRTRDLMAQWRQDQPRWLLEHAQRTTGRIMLTAPVGGVFHGIERIFSQPGAEWAKPFLLPVLRVGVNSARLAASYLPGVGAGLAVREMNAARSPQDAIRYGRRIGLGEDESRRAFQSGSFEREAQLRAGETALGTALMIPILAYAARGNIKGTLPRDPAEADRWRREYGGGDRIKVGNQWLEYQHIPLAGTLRGVADAMQAHMDLAKRHPELANQKTEEWARTALPALTGFAKQVGMSGLTDLGQVLENPLDVDTARRYFGATVKTAGLGGGFEEVNQYVDPYIRQTKGGLLDPLKATIPGVSQKLLPRMSATGEPQPKPSSLPLRPHTESLDVARDEALRLGIELKPQTASTIAVNRGQQVKLGPRNSWHLQTALALATRAAIDTAYQSPNFSSLSDPAKKKVMQTYLEKYRQVIHLRARVDASSNTQLNYQELMAGTRSVQ